MFQQSNFVLRQVINLLNFVSCILRVKNQEKDATNASNVEK